VKKITGSIPKNYHSSNLCLLFCKEFTSCCRESDISQTQTFAIMKHQKETQCVHADKHYQGVNTPVFVSSANAYIGYDENVYPRYFNTENQHEVVEKLCKLEQAEDGLIFGSGMAAISTSLFAFLKQGDHVLLSGQVYGGTYKLVVEEFENYGIAYDFVNESNPAAFREKIRSETRLIYTESPSNPLMSIVDLQQIADLAKEKGLITMVDNTFATPINQNPITLGIDLVIHSGTKYLGGHSDLCFGAVLSSEKLMQKIRNSATNYGGSLNPLDCYLIERSLKTLAVRVEKHNQNAIDLAEFLQQEEKITQVYYPGLPDHPGFEAASRQMKGGFGGMLAFELSESLSVDAFLQSLQLIRPTLSLGGVESIICQPSLTSHVKMSAGQRAKLGIHDNLLRLSVGIENIGDLQSDISQALKAAQLAAEKAVSA
jgi:cystathionine beta-lyase